MSNELLLKTRSVIIAQAAQGSAVSVGSFSSGAQTIIDNSFDGGSENAKGASYLDVFFDVTDIADTSYVDVYIESSIDGTTFSDPEFLMRSNKISASSASLQKLCRLLIVPLYSRLKWKPYSHTIDGILKVVPVLMESQVVKTLSYYATPTALSVGRSHLAATSVGDYALFGGGYTGSRSNVVDAYNTSLTRSTPTPLSVGRYYLAATSVGDYALFGGGYSGAYSNVVDAYNTSLTRSTATALSVGRYYLAATSVGDYALFGGGYSTSAVVDAYEWS